jgi:hypothetical protein
MAKTLKDFLEGYLKVKSADEQKFIDKHVTAKNPDRNGNGDDVFKGSTKAIDRRKDRKGYNPGEDEKVYEELKGKQHKIDANKNGKLDAHDFKLLRAKKKVAEEAEELEELSTEKLLAYRKKAREADTNKHHVYADEADKKIKKKTGVYNPNLLQRAKAKLRNEEAEELEELSQDKLMQYRSAAKKQGTSIQDKMKIGGGDWSKDGKDTSTLKKRMAGYKMAGRKVNPGLSASVGKAPRVAATEEVQIDELSKGTMGRYINKAADRMSTQGVTAGLKIAADEKSKKNFDNIAKRQKGIATAVKKLTREEAEQIDETAKIVAHLQKRYGDNIRKSHVMSAAKDFGVDASKLAKAVRTKLGKNMLGEKLNMDKASMGDVITDFKDSNAPQFKGKSPAKRRVMAIAAKLTAERGGKPLNKEERLMNRLGDISESHQRVMLEVFDKLNEDNKSKFLEACSTPDGVDQMLDFAIRHRGE